MYKLSSALAPFILVTSLTLLAGCSQGPPKIDGSSTANYQKSLSKVLSQVTKDEADWILWELDKQYLDFMTGNQHLAFKYAKTNERAPEYLALIDGQTAESILAKAHERNNRYLSNKKKKDMESGMYALKNSISEKENFLSNYKIYQSLKKIVFDPKLKLIKEGYHTNPFAVFSIKNDSNHTIKNIEMKFSVYEKGRKTPIHSDKCKIHFSASLEPGESYTHKEFLLDHRTKENIKKGSSYCEISDIKIYTTKGHDISFSEFVNLNEATYKNINEAITKAQIDLQQLEEKYKAM